MNGAEVLPVSDDTGSMLLVDVVIPCYNDGVFLREALDGLGAQERCGVLVVNDGSADPGTLEVLDALRSEGVKVIDRGNGGLAAARNTGWQAGTAPFVLFLDADNQLLPGAIDAMAEVLLADPEAGVAIGDRVEFGDREGLVVQSVPSMSELLVGNRVDACAMVRRTVLEGLGGFDEAMREGYEDWEFWIRVLAAGQLMVHVGRPTFRYRVRKGSLLSKADDPATRTAIVGHVVRKHEPLFRLHMNAVVAALHGIQAHDKQLLRQAVQRSEEAIALGVVLRSELDASHGSERVLALQALLAQYEERVRVMESSRLWRLRKQYYRMRALMRTSSDTSRRSMRWIKRITFLLSLQGRTILKKFLAKVFKALYLWSEVRPVRILVGDEYRLDLFLVSGDPYHQHMARHFARPADLLEYRENASMFIDPPLISVVMPIFDPPVHFLESAIRSVVDQAYTHWELCIADDRSTDPEVRKCLERWMKEDSRVKVVFRPVNGHICESSNSAVDQARGSFLAFMDHDDLLAPDALYHIAKRLQQQPALDILYTDEDKVDEQGRHTDPHFKPQWCPDHLLSRNYFGHLVVYRATLVQEVGGFRTGFEGSQDYDLALRCTERTDRIARIPKVLYHWRIHAGSTAHSEEVKPYAFVAARRALLEALERRGEPGEVTILHGYRGYGIRFTSPLRGKVSIIIPTKDKADILRTCLTSIFALTDHPDFEVLVVSNNSEEKELFDLLEEMKSAHPGRFDRITHDVPFNFSELMNTGMKRSTGEQLLFLNNDTEVLHADWLRAMHEWSQRPSIGAVGVKLLYHNDSIQHAGVVIGLGGVAGHTFVGVDRDGPGYFNYINTINNSSAVTAACMMVERAKLDRVGGWNEAFTVEYNDVDLCLRLREAGYNNVYLPHVTLHHYESLTRGHPHLTRESYERHLREVGLFKARWKNYIDDDPCYNPNLSRGVHDWRLA